MLSAERVSVDYGVLFWSGHSVRFSGVAGGFAFADLHFGQLKTS